MNLNLKSKIKKSNIILIGMPGAGKSTIGPALAAKLGMQYTDTDDLVSEKAGMELKTYASQFGKEAFLALQEKTLLSFIPSGCVIATGGSVGCSPVLMEHFKKNGYAIYLKLEYKIIEQRLAPGRNLARDAGKTLEDLYNERSPLYEAYSDIIIDCVGKTVDTIVNQIVNELNICNSD